MLNSDLTFSISIRGGMNKGIASPCQENQRRRAEEKWPSSCSQVCTPSAWGAGEFGGTPRKCLRLLLGSSEPHRGKR